MNAQVLTVSSKGQISIPVDIRRSLSIDTGDKLVVYTSGDYILMRTLKLPSDDEFELAMKEARQWAASVGYKENDVEKVIKDVRKRKK